MTIDELRQKYSSETHARALLERLIWPNGRVCPHCGGIESCTVVRQKAQKQFYQCTACRGQFTVTTKTPLHSTKLPLWKWILTMYYMIHSSKGISSVFMAKYIGVSQKTAWKITHAIREMMSLEHIKGPFLDGEVELDEKFLGGKPRHEHGVLHKRGRGTSKQGILVMIERKGRVRTVLMQNETHDYIGSLVKRHVKPTAHLMTDQFQAYQKLAPDFASHQFVNHSHQEYVRGNVHNNTAESFNAILERAKFGIYHFLSKLHIHRYVNEAAFRWNHRQEVSQKNGKIKMVALPFIEQLASLLGLAIWRQLRRTPNGGIRCCSVYA
jgi:transposase-like protein